MGGLYRPCNGGNRVLGHRNVQKGCKAGGKGHENSDWSVMWGSGNRAKEKQDKLSENMDDKIMHRINMEEVFDWKVVCEISHEVALEVLGEGKKTTPNPMGADSAQNPLGNLYNYCIYHVGWPTTIRDSLH